MGIEIRDICAGLLLATALAVALGVSLALPFVAHLPEAGSPVLVVAPPWSAGAESMVLQAGGHPLGPGSAPFAVLAGFPDVIPVEALRQLGAWAIADGRVLATLCGVS